MKTRYFFTFLIFIGLFLPWFPGDILYEDSPLSFFKMLLNINGLDIEFLDSFNILRMGIAIPISVILLWLWIGFRKNIEQSPVLVTLPWGITLVASFFYVIDQAKSPLWMILYLGLLSGAGIYGIYIFRHYRHQQVGYAFGFLLICISCFMYHFELYREYYAHTNMVFENTYGFRTVWVFFGILLLFPIFQLIKKQKDAGAVLMGFTLSIFGYYAVMHPLFNSGPFLFFADNLITVGNHTASHIQIVVIALGIAIFIGVPIGIYITHHPKLAGIVLYIASIIITIPSIALFGFMMPMLSSLDRVWDGVNGIGIGKVPAIIALALYALLPIIRNTYIAIINVDPGIIEAGRGMGMTGGQLLVKLQLPIAIPVIMAGVRTAVVMSIAIAAVAAYIGAGGLGLFVSEGLQMATNNSVVAGAICMSLLAVIADMCFEKAGKWLTPKGLKAER